MNFNRQKKSLPTITLVLALFGVGLGATGFGIFRLYRGINVLQAKLSDVAKNVETEQKAVKIEPTIIRPGAAPATTWVGVQRQVKNTVVKIVTDIAAFNWLEPYKTAESSRASGTGFFINGDGDIVTNYHNITQARAVQIELPAFSAERLDVEIIGASPERDLALLRLTSTAREKIQKSLGQIPFLKLGNSDEVKRGQEVLAIGYPMGVQSLKSTQGIVSGRERIQLIKQSCIQTTAPLNPGNSGGPSINASGEVVGINFAGVIKAQNVGYLIPINDVKAAIKDLYKIKLLRRPVLGGLLEPANGAMISYFKNPDPGGYYVAHVYKGMMFEKVGIKAGDMIYEMNGFTLDRFGQAKVSWNEDKVGMVEMIARLEVGDKVDMVVYRDGERKEIDFILEPRLLQPIRFIYPEFEEVDYEAIAGMVVMELSQNHIAFLAERARGLLIYDSHENQYEPALVLSHVQPTSLLSKMRLLSPGMIITEINGEKVKTLKDFRAAVAKSRQTRFLTVRTKDHIFVVFAVENIVKDEDRLAKIYQFKKSDLISVIA